MNRVVPKSWFEIYKKLPVNSENRIFFDKLHNVFKEIQIEAPDKAYVYLAEFDYGDFIIKNGKVDFSSFNFIGNQFAGKEDFDADLSYSSDPLAIFINGQGLVVSKEGLKEFPIDRIDEGDLIGVFGASDMIVYGKDTQEGEENWDLIAGDLSFNLIFDFNDKNFSDLHGSSTFYENINNHNQIQTNKEIIKTIEFNEKVLVAYLPRHIFTYSSKNKLINHIELINHILKTGWKQTLSLRSFIFNHSSLNNVVKNISGDKFQGVNKRDLALIIKYCCDVAYGHEYALTKTDDSDKTIVEYKKAFLDRFEDLDLQPFFLKNKKIKRKGEVRYISLDFPPFILENSSISGGNLIAAYHQFVKQRIKNNNKIPIDLREKYATLNLKFYHHKGRIEERGTLKLPDGNNLHEEFEVDKKIKFPKPKGCINTFIKIESRLDNYFTAYPVISTIAEKLTGKDLSNYYIISVQHLLSSTGSMFEGIINNGFNPSNIFLTGKIYSTHLETERILEEELGVNIYKYHNTDLLGNYSESLTTTVKKMWQDVLVQAPSGSNIIILDDGGYCLKNVPNKVIKDYNVFGIEQTTSGIKLNKNLHKIPIIDVAGSAIKVKIEPNLISEAVNIQLHNKINTICPESIGVVGFGHIGKAVANEYFRKGYKICIYDIKDEIEKENISSFNICNSLEELIDSSDIIIGATGEDITKNLNFETLLGNINKSKVFMSVSSGDIEFKTLIKKYQNSFESCLKSSKTPILQDKILKIKKGVEVKFLRGGMVSNFTGSADSSPGKYIQITRGILLSAIVQITNNSERIKTSKDIIKLDSSLQQEALEIWFNNQPNKKIEYCNQLISNFKNQEWIFENSYGN